MAMRRTLLLACLAIVLSPAEAIACGRCTDSLIIMDLPWAGLGTLLVWLWIGTTVAARLCLGGRDAGSGLISATAGTLIVFALLGAVGSPGLYRATLASQILPSLSVGIVWFLYLAIRIAIDLVRLVVGRDPAARTAARTSLAFDGGFLLTALLLVAAAQTRARSLDYRIDCLRFGSNTAILSPLMPGIVADGDKAVAPLIRACREAIAGDDLFERANVLEHATYCLERIGGPEAEAFLADLVRRHVAADDFHDRRWYRHVCYSYARVAGPRAVPDLVDAFERMPATARSDDRACVLVALTMTACAPGVGFTLDHMDVLLREMHEQEDSRSRAARAAAEALVFGVEPDSLKLIPAHRFGVLIHLGVHPKSPPNDFSSEFFWTDADDRGRRKLKAIEAGWTKDSAIIRERWSGRFGGA